MYTSNTATKESKSSLQLDPGPEPRTKSTRPFSICRCLCCVFLGVNVVISLCAFYLGFKAVQNFWNKSMVPHPTLYYNDTLFEPHQVVRPLIEFNQTFDIVATVWIREFEGESPSQTRGIQLIERPIFTDTIFRGIKMSKKIYRTSVDLEIPTAAFKDELLGNYDLRGSFVLVPNQPSLMDSVLNYSTWVPPEAMRPPSRAYPDHYTRTLADEVADAYGVFTPLLSFHEIKSRCQIDEEKEGAPPNVNEKQIDTEESWRPIKPKAKIEITTEGKPVLRAHPYIITRTHLNIMDMTRLYDRKKFEVGHRRLSLAECGERSHNGFRSPESPPNWRLCHTSFQSHANCEVMIEYSPDKGQLENSSISSNLAYAPYMVVDPHWGPLDLVPVPVNREECSPINEDPKVVNITWNISFGSITPGKHNIASTLGHSFQKQLNMSGTEEAIQSMHSLFEITQALLGQRFNQDRPPAWIALLFSFSSLFFLILGRALFFVYWYKLSSSSTLGISIIGTISSAMGSFLSDILGDLTAPVLSFQWMSCALTQALPFFMIKAVTRGEFVWSKNRWITLPIGVRFARSTHAERTSQRVEARTSWRFRIFTFIFFAATFSLAKIYDLDPLSPKRDRFGDLSRIEQMKLIFQTFFSLPMLNLGIILQVIMNLQSNTFAGAYKLGICFDLLGDLCTVIAAYFHPSTFDRLDMFFALSIMLQGILFCQAIMYPKPKLVADSDDD